LRKSCGKVYEGEYTPPQFILINSTVKMSVIGTETPIRYFTFKCSCFLRQGHVFSFGGDGGEGENIPETLRLGFG
jgi:hypothetical protein